MKPMSAADTSGRGGSNLGSNSSIAGELRIATQEFDRRQTGRLFFDDDRVLLAKHVDRGWTIPGGRLEPGETALDCLIREAREEAGVEIADARIVAHNRIEMLDEAPEGWPYRQPSYQVFYVARVVAL